MIHKTNKLKKQMIKRKICLKILSRIPRKMMNNMNKIKHKLRKIKKMIMEIIILKAIIKKQMKLNRMKMSKKNKIIIMKCLGNLITKIQKMKRINKMLFKKSKIKIN